jgi:TorA maturation chaperone TorD
MEVQPMKRTILVFCLAALVIFAIPSHASDRSDLLAQATLNTIQKFQLLTAVVEEAEKQVSQGKKNDARFYLLASTGMYQSLGRTQDPQVQSLIQRFQKLEMTLWPDNTQDRLVQLLQELKTNLDEYKPKLTRYGMMFDFLTPHGSWGFDQWARYVIDALNIYPEAYKCATEFASKVPMPDVFLLQPALNIGAYQLVPSLFNIMLGEELAKENAKKDVLPRSLKKAEEEISGLSSDEKRPGIILIAARNMRTYAGYALKIDKDNAEGKELIKKAEALEEKAAKLYAAQVKENRMPEENYSGPEKESVRAAMQKAYEKAFPGEQVLKVIIISSDWVERAEAWSNSDGSVSSGIFRYLEGAIAAKRKDGRYWVFYSRFARQWTGRGDTFGEIFHSCPLNTSYEILKENI